MYFYLNIKTVYNYFLSNITKYIMPSFKFDGICKKSPLSNCAKRILLLLVICRLLSGIQNFSINDFRGENATMVIPSFFFSNNLWDLNFQLCFLNSSFYISFFRIHLWSFPKFPFTINQNVNIITVHRATILNAPEILVLYLPSTAFTSWILHSNTICQQKHKKK